MRQMTVGVLRRCEGMAHQRSSANRSHWRLGSINLWCFKTSVTVYCDCVVVHAIFLGDAVHVMYPRDWTECLCANAADLTEAARNE